MRTLSDKLQARRSIDRPSLQFALSVVMSGMSKPKVVHQLQVIGETCCSTTKQTRRHCMCIQTRIGQRTSWPGSLWSCTVEKYGSHMNDCSVAKQSLVALSSGEAEFYGIVRAVATSKQASHILEQIGKQLEVTVASDSSAARGLGICDIFQSKNCGYRKRTRKKEFQMVPVDTLLNWADIGTKAHTSERLTSLLRQVPLRLACLTESIENTVQATEGMKKVVMTEPRRL